MNAPRGATAARRRGGERCVVITRCHAWLSAKSPHASDQKTVESKRNTSPPFIVTPPNTVAAHGVLDLLLLLVLLLRRWPVVGGVA